MWIHTCFVLRGFDKELQMHDGFSEISMSENVPVEVFNLIRIILFLTAI